MDKAEYRGEPPTQKQIDSLCFWLGKGALVDTAAARVGIPAKIFQLWLKAAHQKQEPYATFVVQIEEALIKFECKLLDFIEENANKNVNSAQWLFKMRFGTKYEQAAKVAAGIIDNVSTMTAPDAPTQEQITAAEARAYSETLRHEHPTVLAPKVPVFKHTSTPTPKKADQH